MPSKQPSHLRTSGRQSAVLTALRVSASLMPVEVKISLYTFVPCIAPTRHSRTRGPELDCSRAALGGGLINKRPTTQIEFGAFCFVRRSVERLDSAT